MDPICFEKDIRVTMQQIGLSPYGLFERQDDVCSVAYWYLDSPCGFEARLTEREEEQINKRAEGKEQVADKEILAVKDIPSADQVEITPEIISEYTGQAGDEDDNTVDQCGFPAADTKHVHTEGHDIFKYSDHS